MAELAQEIAQQAEKAGAEVRLRPLPTRPRASLADKVYSGFTAAGTLHGGHEATLLALYQSFHHFGGIVVAPGYTAPGSWSTATYDTSWHRAGHDAVALDDVTRAAARVRVPRVVRFARAVVAAG